MRAIAGTAVAVPALLVALLAAGAQAFAPGAASGAAPDAAPNATPDATPCPCDDAELCRALRRGFRAREVLGFTAAANGAGVDWTRVSTIAWPPRPSEYVGNASLLCQAHARDVRLLANDDVFARVPITESARERAAWIQGTVEVVQSRGLDGLVFDYEEPQPVGSPQAQWYVELIRETRLALRRADPVLSIVTCVAWSPDVIDGRGYDAAALAAASDLLYVMDYDTRSQIFDACIAAANAPLPGTKKGVQRFLDLGIHASQLVLGQPWYGYRYPCVHGTERDARFCPIPQVPFRNVSCSDAAGSQVAFRDLQAIARAANATLQWDDNQAAPYFNTVENNETVQYWYDNPQSLRSKYAFAAELGLRGVGPYTFSDAPADEFTDMWDALDVFLRRPAAIAAQDEPGVEALA
jgi:di-N-acetylchitobiase